MPLADLFSEVAAVPERHQAAVGSAVGRDVRRVQKHKVEALQHPPPPATKRPQNEV
jgi:hypothetical protein